MKVKGEMKKNLILTEEGCQCQDVSNRSPESSMYTTKRKLLCLLFIATLALFSIVLITEQLIMRHISRSENSVPALTILTLEEWAPEEPPILTKSNGILTHQSGLKIIEDGIFWAPELEAQISFGPSDAQVQYQLQELRQRKVTKLEKPDWLHCGRDKNRFVHFEDGNQACARFRSNHAEFVQGEVMAFYLARLLGINNTPAVILSQVRLSDG